MFHRIHQKLGTAGFIISIVALVAALGGGAYAAKGSLTGKQKKEVEKIAKKYAGKPGQNGQNGTNGAPGAKGDTGAAGAQGQQGDPGGPGERGPAGPEGETGFATELPAGETETGAWTTSFFTEEDVEGGEAESGYPLWTALSFPAPLPSGQQPTVVVMAPGASPTAECPGNAAEPRAAEGKLCVYESPFAQGGEVTGALSPGSGAEAGGVEDDGEADRYGSLLAIFAETEFGHVFGTWAVTAEAE